MNGLLGDVATNGMNQRMTVAKQWNNGHQERGTSSIDIRRRLTRYKLIPELGPVPKSRKLNHRIIPGTQPA